MVNRDVGKRKSETNIAKYKGKKQMPAIVSRLTALLFFSPPSATSKENVLKSVSFSGTNIANEVSWKISFRCRFRCFLILRSPKYFLNNSFNFYYHKSLSGTDVLEAIY